MRDIDIDSFAIYVGASEEAVARAIPRAAAAGFHTVRLRFDDLESVDELDVYLAHTFQYPWKTRGLNAAVDMISDLGWLAPARGYLFLASGCGSSEVAKALGWVVPSIIDRWRSRGRWCVFALEGRSAVFEAEAVAASAELEAASHLPWVAPGTGPVPLIDAS